MKGPWSVILQNGAWSLSLYAWGLTLAACGLRSLALEACAFLFLVACNDSGAAKHGSLFLFVITSVNELTSVKVWIVLFKEVS